MADTAFDFQPETESKDNAFDFQEESPAAPTKQSASADFERATQLPQQPTLPAASGRLDIGPAPFRQGTAAQEQERTAGPGYRLAPTDQPTRLTPTPAPAVPNQLTPTPTPRLADPRMPDIGMKDVWQQYPTVPGSRAAPSSPEAQAEEMRLANLLGAQGPARVSRGLDELLPTSTRPNPTLPQAERGATDILGGAGETLTPVFIGVGAAAPIATTLGAVAGGTLAHYGAGKIADLVHASPEVKGLVQEVASWAGAIAGAGTLADENGEFRGAGRIKAALPTMENGLTELLWKRGFITDNKGQQIQIISKSDARNVAQEILKQNPEADTLLGGIRASRAATRFEPAERVEGEYVGPRQIVTPKALPPPSRAEAAEYLDRANFDPQKAQELYARDKAAQVAPPPAAVQPSASAAPAGAAASVPGETAPAPSVTSVTPKAPKVPKISAPTAAKPVEAVKVDFQPESEVEQVRRRPPAPTPAPTKQENQVPVEQRASNVIAKEEQEKLAGRMEARGKAKADLEKGVLPESDTSQSSETPTKYKYGSTQANIPAESEAAKSLETARARISKADLMPQGGAAMGGRSADDGLETEPHVTVRYGLKGDDTEGVKKFLNSIPPFEASLGKTDKFPPSEHSEGAAVIIAPIEAPQLHQINSEIEKHGDFAESNFPEYRPHATVAYVKPEVADRYVGMDVTHGKKFTVNEIAITDRNGKQEMVKLGGKAAPKTPKKPDYVSAQEGSWFTKDKAVAQSYGHMLLGLDVPKEVAEGTDISLPGKSVHAVPEVWRNKAQWAGEMPTEPPAGMVRLYRGINDLRFAPKKAAEPFDFQPETEVAVPETKPAKAETKPSERETLGMPPKPGEIGNMQLRDLKVAPQRFQYKLTTDAEGVGTLLKETKVFNPDLAGIVSVWRDPADGKTYVVNGHHRVKLARRTGQKTLAVRHIKAANVQEARAVGARQNIAEGRGTPVDAAKFFRDTGITPADLEQHGISLGEATARQGLALSKLDTPIFNKVVSGDLRVGRGVAIGEATADPAEQKAILALVDKRERGGGKVSDGMLTELIRLVKGSEQATESTADLFGSQEINRSLALEKADISDYIKQQLAKDKKLFGFVAKEGRATELARVGNRIDVERSKEISSGAAQAEEVYNKLSSRGGPISSILDSSARRLADGEHAGTVKSDAYQKVRAEVSKTLGGEEAPVSQGLEAGAGRPEAPADEPGKPTKAVDQPNLRDIEPSRELFTDPKTGELKTRIGMNKERGIRMTITGLYKDRTPAKMTVEMLQNAFDEVLQNPDSKQRRIDFIAGSDNSVAEKAGLPTGTTMGTIEIADSGRGLTPEQLGTVFTDVYESGKSAAEGAAGGWGVAKTSFQLGGKYFRAVSTVKGGDGSLHTYVIEGSPDELLAGVPIKEAAQPGLLARILDKGAPRGTGLSVKVWLDPKKDPYTFGALDYFEKAAKTSPADIMFRRSSLAAGREPITIERAPTKQIGTVEVPGATLKMSVSEETSAEPRTYAVIRVLNQGLYQFDQTIFLGNQGEVAALPAFIVADVSPTVRPGHEDYPFTQSRESLTTPAEKAVGAHLSEKLLDALRKQRVSALRREWSDIAESPIRVADGRELKVAVYDEMGAMGAEQMLKSPYWQNYLATVREAQQWFLDALPEATGHRPISKLGVFFPLHRVSGSQRSVIFGINIPNPSTESEAVFLNPLGTGARNAIFPERPKFETALQMARHQWNTIIHEFAHNEVRSHGVPFEGAMAEINALIPPDVEGEFVDRIAAAIAGHKEADYDSRPAREYDEALQSYLRTRRDTERPKVTLGGTGVDAASSRRGQDLSRRAPNDAGHLPTGLRETGVESAAIPGLTEAELADWSKSKGFRTEDAGEQLGMFGDNDKLLRAFRVGPRGKEQSGLIYQSQLDALRAQQAAAPTEPFALTGGETREEQPRLFGAGDLGEIIGPTSKTQPRPLSTIEQAREDWNANRAYWDGSNFRYSKKSGTASGQPIEVPPELRGKVTPWNAEVKKAGGLEALKTLFADESGSLTPAALNPARINKLYDDFINRVIDRNLDLGDKYIRVADHDDAIAKMLHEKDHAPRYFRDKAQSNVDQVIKGLNEHQTRLTAMMADSDSREYLQEKHPDQFKQAQDDPAVMAAVEKFKPYQEQLAALRLKLGWHVRRDLSVFENEEAQAGENRWMVLDREGNPVADFKQEDAAKAYVVEKGQVLDHLKRTYPEHLREPLMGQTVSGPATSGGYSGGIRPPRPDKKQRLSTAQYFYEHGAKDFSGYLQSFTQASHAALNQKIFDTLTDEATKWTEGTAQPPQIEYRGKTYYRPDVAQSMRQGIEGSGPGGQRLPSDKRPLEYRAYDPAKDDKLLIKSFEDGWATFSTGKPGIGFKDRWLAPKQVVDALDNYDKTRGVEERDRVRRFFQEQIVGLFGPNIHVLNIMRRLAQTVGTGAWDPRVWPYYQKLFFSKELRDRMAQGLADDAIDALSKNGVYTNVRDIGSIHDYFLGNINPMNWVRHTVGKFSKGVLFDPKFMGGFGGLDQKARVLAYDLLRDREGWSEQESAKHVEDGFGNYDRANWTERMKRWARFLLFPGWDFASFKWILRHPIVTALAPAAVTMGANLAINAAGKNKDQDKYDFAYLHYGDRKLRTSLFTESMALHMAEPVLSAAKAALEGGDARDIGAAAGEGALRGGGGLAGSLRPEVQWAIEMLSNRQYLGGAKEIVKPEDRSIPGKVLPNRDLEKRVVFTLVKALPAIGRFLDSSYDNVDLATGVGSIIGVTNYRSGAEERLKANVAKSMGYSETLAKLAETDASAAEKFVQDPAKAPYLVMHNDFDQLAKDLADLDKQAETVKMAGELGQNERKEILRDLDQTRKQILSSADALDDALTAAKLQMKGSVQ